MKPVMAFLGRQLSLARQKEAGAQSCRLVRSETLRGSCFVVSTDPDATPAAINQLEGVV